MRHPGVVLLLLVVVACGGKKEEPKPEKKQEQKQGSGTGTQVGPGPVIVDAAPVAVVDAAPAAAPPLVDLPPLVIADADEDTIKNSVNLNNAGYAAHKKKDWPTAEAKYTEAVRADPGNLRARFNLAC